MLHHQTQAKQAISQLEGPSRGVQSGAKGDRVREVTGDKLQHMFKAGTQETSYLSAHAQSPPKAHPKGHGERHTYSRTKARPRLELIWSSWAPHWTQKV